MRLLLVILLFTMLGRAWAGDAAPPPAAENHPYLRAAAKALVGADGRKADQAALLKPKRLFIYFSAHWCPPCRAFTPELVKYYQEKGGGSDFAILFVSSDEDEQHMLGYMKEAGMPWPGLRFGSSKMAEIKRKYGGEGIPCLTLLDEKDEILAHSYVDGAYVGPHAVLRQYEQLGAAPAAQAAPAALAAPTARAPAGDPAKARDVDEFIARVQAGGLGNAVVMMPMAPVADLADHRALYAGATARVPPEKRIDFAEVRVIAVKQAVLQGKGSLVMHCELRGRSAFLVIDISDPKQWFATMP